MQSKLALSWSASFYHTVTAIYRHNIVTCSIKKILMFSTIGHNEAFPLETRAHNQSSGALNGWLSLFIREWMRQYVCIHHWQQTRGWDNGHTATNGPVLIAWWSITEINLVALISLVPLMVYTSTFDGC